MPRAALRQRPLELVSCMDTRASGQARLWGRVRRALETAGVGKGPRAGGGGWTGLETAPMYSLEARGPSVVP